MSNEIDDQELEETKNEYEKLKNEYKNYQLYVENTYPRCKVRSLLGEIIFAGEIYWINELIEINDKNFGLLKDKSLYDLAIINYIIASDLIKLIPVFAEKETVDYKKNMLSSQQLYYEFIPNSFKKATENNSALSSVDIKFYPVGLTDKGYYFLHPVKTFLRDYKYWFTTAIAVIALIVSIFN